MLITFEGLPCCGAKTQQKLLAESLSESGFDPVVKTCEPGWNNETSGLIKYMALEGNTSPIEKLFLFLADRAGHFERFIRPILQQGTGIQRYPRGEGSNYHEVTRPVIISDKGPDSTVAYQGFAAGLWNVRDLVSANTLAMQGIKIDTTIVLDISPEEMQKRMPEHKEGRAHPDPEFYHRVRKGYSEICQIEPERVISVDGTGTPEEVHKRVHSVIMGRVQGRLN